MTAMLVLSALVAAQAVTSVPGPDTTVIGSKEVAYEALAERRDTDAVAQLEARLLEEPNDPALLINLGTAYARVGKTERAAAAFRAAIDSDTRYRLELADGSWIDSRQAARLALAGLETRGSLARAGD